MNPVDQAGDSRDLFFDTNCIQYLDLNWRITKKRVSVVSPNFHFTKSENLILQPLKNCNKHSEGRWKKAYQAIKHNRVDSLYVGNIANLIRAMATLYLLNIYYRDEKYDVGTVLHTTPFDCRLGSDIFSVSLAHAEKCAFTAEMSDDSIQADVRNQLDSAVILQKYTEDSFRTLHQSMIDYNVQARERLLSSPEVLQFF